MSDEELAAIEGRANAAIPGPWWHKVRSFNRHISNNRYGFSFITINLGDLDENKETEDIATAQFIAAAREDVPALVAEVRRLQTVLKDAKAGWLAELKEQGAMIITPVEGMTVEFPQNPGAINITNFTPIQYIKNE